ncbi:hypothetical protein ISN44_As05g031730 [Arabidopsis suecica]|uniref:DUF577 domain-containing protein n=1 Tax=Arabidopsis suecica TaxID=45249 RepID=A0A8T2DLA3_ARASU|nr:hypothetical protein ISN44_As05g031690 [Arabidopsis suecica]KAG7611057.1 hypothetical protein ISN44_As05g031730 [Arabidopsis suecica]
MTESLNRQLIAREILVSESHEELAMIVDNLFKRKESEEYKTSRALYDYCVSYNLGCLTLKLLKLYQSSSNGILRLRSLYQLSQTLTGLRNRKLSLDSLYEIKTLLIPCLTMQETKESDVKILSKIVSCVAYNVVELHKDKWDELGDCILSLASSEEPVKAFHVFIDMPPGYEELIKKFLTIILEKAKEVLLNPEESGVEEWSLALQTVVKLGIQFFNTGMKQDVIKKILRFQLVNIVESAKKLLDNGNETFLVRVLQDFERFVSRDMNLYKYSEVQCRFVSTFVSQFGKLSEVGTQTNELVTKINMLFTKQQPHETQDHGEEFDRAWYDHLKYLSSLELLKIFASTDLEDRTREMAIRRLEVVLSRHNSKKAKIDISEMRKLQSLLMSCLKEQGVSYSMFQVLGQVVNHVAYEMLVYQGETCYELRDYIASSKTEFQIALYIFQCLTMPLVDDDFVIPVMEKLFPEIITRLDPPTVLLVDNSCWVLVFRGAFCAAIHLIEDPGYAKYVKEIAHKMIDSIRELVEREMEVGIVRRAFRDVETIVKKQLEWYSTSQYRFVKGLLWRLYVLKGMKWESKIVLWRISVIVERGVKEMEKELPENEFDWLNLTY